MSHAHVKVRANDSLYSISVTSPEKPAIQDEVIKKWQHIIDICAQIMGVPSGLIMKLHEDEIEVFLSSEGDSNPYSPGEKERLGIGLYCETVAAKREHLLVPDATKDEVWKDNPDIKSNMISYLGMPLIWPDDEVFGTICVLDSKRNHFSNNYYNLLQAFRNTIEADLKLLVASAEMEKLAHTDPLSKLYNRLSIDEKMSAEYNRATRYDSIYSVILLDIDDFKGINDTFGHSVGDQVIVKVAQLIKARVRSCDFAARWGGEEFLVICTETELPNASELAESIRALIESHRFPLVGQVTCSLGVSSFKSSDARPEDCIHRADGMLYEAKRLGKNRVASNSLKAPKE